MNTVELIVKKRNGGVLTEAEIAYIISGYVSGEIPDYQMSALLMAIFYSGMSDAETLCLTREMIKSGDTLDLGGIDGIKADKHSTGGVGDKISLVLCPLLAACGVKIAKMSGRGLGHTGGTIDKLESFSGFTTGLDAGRFIEQANDIGLVIAGQTGSLVPADKKLYALRDVTGTVDILPLIVSSIMSKKLASGADVIVLDVKAGGGAFMKDEKNAFLLAEKMVKIGKDAGKKTAAVVSEMDQPLGYAVGNALEIKEAVEVLRGAECDGVRSLCLELGASALVLAGMAGDSIAARRLLEEKIADGGALEKLAQMVKAQGGDERAVYDTSLLPEAPCTAEVRSQDCGYVIALDAEGVGMVCIMLGGGRLTKESQIDLSVGVILRKKIGDYVEKGEALAVIHAKTAEQAREAGEKLLKCYEFSAHSSKKRPLIKGIVN